MAWKTKLSCSQSSCWFVLLCSRVRQQIICIKYLHVQWKVWKYTMWPMQLSFNIHQISTATSPMQNQISHSNWIRTKECQGNEYSTVESQHIEGQRDYPSLMDPCMEESAVWNSVRLCYFPVTHWNNPVPLVWDDSRNHFGRLTSYSSCLCFLILGNVEVIKPSL